MLAPTPIRRSKPASLFRTQCSISRSSYQLGKLFYVIRLSRFQYDQKIFKDFPDRQKPHFCVKNALFTPAPRYRVPYIWRALFDAPSLVSCDEPALLFEK